MTGLERRIHRLNDDLANAREAITATETEVDRAKARLGQPFEHSRELTQACHRQQEIAELLTPEPAQSTLATETPDRPAATLAR